MTKTKTGWEHGGVQITINSVGQFEAVIGGRRVVKGSLESIRKLLDKKPEMEPFEAVVADDWHSKLNNRQVTGLDGYSVVKIVEVRRTKNRRYGPMYELVSDNGTAYRHGVEEFSPANIKAIKASKEWDEETSRIDSERYKESRKLRKNIVVFIPDGTGGVKKINAS